MAFSIIRASDCRRMPWKNGGGETIEVAVSPPGAELDRFDWRLSLATVASDGPFSAFPEIDRTLTILDGEGIDLSVGDAPSLRLTTASAPLAFPADVASAARLIGGPVTDLNVMTRRDRFCHEVTPLALSAPLTVCAGGGVLIVFCQGGEIVIGDDVRLGPRDALLLSGVESLQIAPRDEQARVLVMSILPRRQGLPDEVRPKVTHLS